MNTEDATLAKRIIKHNNTSKFKIVLETQDDDSRPIYISGNFNNWRTQDKDFMMERIKENTYHFEFKNDFIFPEELVYKFTKGDWSEVEIDADGNPTANRSVTNFLGIQKEYVPKWRKNWLPFKQLYLPQVLLISDEFEIPQLNKTRKIWALLPHDYDNSNEQYPVMYLQDAQNLFNEDAPQGNWEIDKKLAVMAEYNIGKIIIIAIEHAEEEREKEYNVGKTALGKGQGKKYIKFISETLKPFVDKQFRTKPEREFTGIGGSSLGGLISVFGGLMYPKVYGKLMAFSPSLWVSPKLTIDTENEHNEETKVYLYAGDDESESLVEQVKNFQKNLIANQFVKDKMKINLSINKEGKQNETYWSDEFPKAIEWLYFNTKAS